jgi:hypothetical protein
MQSILAQPEFFSIGVPHSYPGQGFVFAFSHVKFSESFFSFYFHFSTISHSAGL